MWDDISLAGDSLRGRHWGLGIHFPMPGLSLRLPGTAAREALPRQWDTTITARDTATAAVSRQFIVRRPCRKQQPLPAKPLPICAGRTPRPLRSRWVPVWAVLSAWNWPTFAPGRPTTLLPNCGERGWPSPWPPPGTGFSCLSRNLCRCPIGTPHRTAVRRSVSNRSPWNGRC